MWLLNFVQSIFVAMRTKIFVLIFILSVIFSCNKKENLVYSPVAQNFEQVHVQAVVNQFIQHASKKNIGKSEAFFIPADSFNYYLQIVSNALITDLDTPLINIEQARINIEILPTQNGNYTYSYLISKVYEIRDSLTSGLPANFRIYNIEPLTNDNNGNYSLGFTIGQMNPLNTVLGKAINPYTGLNYFASTDQYRFGYGNETKMLTGEVKGGRPDYGQTDPCTGNGLVYEGFGKYMWYGGSNSNSLPTYPNQKYAGAAKMLETYGQNNIFATYGWPSAAPSGYKYIYDLNNIEPILVDYHKTFTQSNSWYNPNLLTNRTNQLLPSLVATKFCTGAEILSGLSLPGGSVWQPVWLTSSQLNFYLNAIPPIYNYIKTNNPTTNGKVLYRFDVVPIYFGLNEVHCGNQNCNPLMNFSSDQWFTPFDPVYFPDACMYVQYKHKYRFIFATRTLVPDPNSFLGL